MMTTTVVRQPIPAVPRDPRLVAQEIADVQRRLDHVYEGARRAFHAIPDTLEATILDLQREADLQSWETHHLATRAGMLQEHYQHVTTALAAAAAAHDTALATLAAHEVEVTKLRVATSVRDADTATALKDRTSILVIADLELRTLVKKIAPMMVVFEAALARRVQAAAILARRRHHAHVVRQLAYAKAIVDAVQATRTKEAGDESLLLGMLDHLRRKRNEPLPIPHLVWPSGLADPFAPPKLSE